METSKWRAIVFWAFISISLIVGLVLLLLNEKGLLHRLGEALFVAGFLASTVDLFVKKRLAQDIARDVSPYIVGHELPPRMQEETRVIQRVELFRRKMQIDYTITPKANMEYIELKTRTQFIVENLTDRNRTFRFQVGLQKAVPGRESTIVNVGVRGLPRNIDFNYTGEKIILVEEETLFKTITFVKEIDIPPTRDRSQEVICWWETNEVLTLDDSDVFYFKEPTLGVTVTVDYPDEFQVTVGFGHRNGDQQIKIPPTDRPRTWKLEAAFLPYQSIMLDWRQLPQRP